MGGQPLSANLSESQKKELSSIDSMRGIVAGALKAVKETPSAFNLQRGLGVCAAESHETS